MKALGMTNLNSEDIKKMVKEIDVDGNNSVDFQEFVLLMV